MSGAEVPGLEHFDQFARDLVRESGGPGLSLAVVRQGRLVFARGYGYSRLETHEPVLPSTLFRANSTSKWITNAAAQELIKEGVLTADDLAFAKWLPETLPGDADERLNGIRLWHLFAHGVPWRDDRRCRFDLAASELGAPVPTPPQMMVHLFTRNQPLAGPVGQAYAYHNTNHVVLARVIERATGMGYEEFIQKRMLEPLGIRRMRIGNTRRADLSAHESFVYSLPDNPMGSVGLPQSASVEPRSHQLCMNEMQDANGGWLASAPDMALLASKYEVSDYRVTEPGRYQLYAGVHLGGAVGGWGLSVAISQGAGNGMALFINGADGATEWAKPKDPLVWWIVGEMRRLANSTETWPEGDLRQEMEESLRSALPVRLGVDALQWTIAAGGEGGEAQVIEIQAGEGDQWHLVSSATWLESSSISGTGPASVTVRANHNGLWAGKYYGTLAIENAAAHSDHHSIPLSLTISGEDKLPAVSIRRQILPLLDRDQELNIQFAAEGGRAPYTWSILEELPAGFRFSAADARLTGQSSADLSQEITVRVADATGASAIRRWMLSVNMPLAQPLFRPSLLIAEALNAQPCTTTPQDRFASTQANLVAALLASGGTHFGDELVFEWIGPDGRTRSRMRYNLPYDLQGNATNRCHASGLFALSGVPAAARRGEWSVRVLYNRNLVSERKFTVE